MTPLALMMGGLLSYKSSWRRLSTMTFIARVSCAQPQSTAPRNNTQSKNKERKYKQKKNKKFIINYYSKIIDKSSLSTALT